MVDPVKFHDAVERINHILENNDYDAAAAVLHGLVAAASKPLGTKTFRLISVAPFKPESQKGQKVEARGLIYTEPGDERINLTSLRPTGANCQ